MVANLILAIFNGLAAIPKMVDQVESIAKAITLWWVQRQSAEISAAIADAAAMGARAKTQEERLLVSKKWQEALSKPRVTP